MTLGLACALLSGCVLFLLVLWRVVCGGKVVEGGPVLRCSEGDCSEGLVLESSFYRRSKPSEPFRRVKCWRCAAGHAYLSVEGKWCEQFDRDARRDSQAVLKAADPAEQVRSTPQGVAVAASLPAMALEAGGASARPSIPGRQFQGARA